jgi:hypothetical protein
MSKSSTRPRTARLAFAAAAVSGLLLAACSGEAKQSEETKAPVASEPAPESTPAETTPAETTPGETTPGETTPVDSTPTDAIPGYDDPRGQIFTDFQASYTRSGPFESLDSFCMPNDPAADRVATDPGITADTISIHHMRQQLEKLKDIGFAVEIGDTKAMFEAFVNEINENCGGIRGRKLDLGMSEFNPLGDFAAESNAACVEATEDREAVIALNSSGFQGPAVLCLTEEHDTILLTTQGLSTEFADRSGGRLFTLDAGLDESLTALAKYAINNNLLEGKVIGVVGSDQGGQPEAVQAGLIDVLAEAGIEVAVADTLGCNGGSTCAEGLQESVSNMLAAGVDVLIPTLNVTSFPGYLGEMVTQGYQPGEVQFMVSNFNSATGDLVSSKAVAFGGEAAGNLYNGAIMVDAAATGNFRLEGAEIPPFNKMCIDTYVKNGGPAYDYFDGVGNTQAGMVATVCTEMRIMARAIYNAGDNPTRADIQKALANLGPLDNNNMTPASLTEGKNSTVDAFQAMKWTFPCEFGAENAFDANNTCVVPSGEYYSIRD